MGSPEIHLIAAIDRAGGVGRGGELLVRIADDQRRFKALTTGHPILMGRKTWDSIGRPLPGRRNIVITRNTAWHADGAEPASSWAAALALAGAVDRVFVIGGAALWALALPMACRLELTEIDASYPADTFFPSWPREAFRESARESRRTGSGLAYDFATYERIEEAR